MLIQVNKGSVDKLRVQNIEGQPRAGATIPMRATGPGARRAFRLDLMMFNISYVQFLVPSPSLSYKTYVSNRNQGISRLLRSRILYLVGHNLLQKSRHYQLPQWTHSLDATDQRNNMWSL